MADRVKAAVITEWHPFDVMNFQALLWRLDGIDAYPQAWDIFAQDPNRDLYDVVVYYNMSFPAPAESDPRRRYLEDQLGSTPQGIVLLHHAILSYENWPFWNVVSGTTDRSFKYFPSQQLRCRVVSDRHPITRGVGDFRIVDESYAMAEPDEDNEVLVTTDHPKSLRSIAWTRDYRSSRVFCYQSGHDNSTWSDSTFQTLLRRGILWAARRLD
ncbi:ThuA domain-containing protein [Rugosimonospora africana]|uniref:ThuA-like domain-containing protein n=1 Tax=Rugosimonospora africana TaxID=556532 RepID=A0A8J3VRT5_9ACTN|nr:ThuA domain-containing protein [Rugosimonospora africana]GIH16570.1 hypothetical protein Raf01_47420 [Rugosimonospora africana]